MVLLQGRSSTALEAVSRIKDECVRAFCLDILKRRKSIHLRTAALSCLSHLANPRDLQVFERAETKGDYDREWIDLRNDILFLRIVRQRDFAGRSQPSRDFAAIAEEDRLRREEMYRDPHLQQFFMD